MIPLKDSTRPRSFPIINYLLIFFNIGVYFKQLQLSPEYLPEFISTYGLIPQKFSLLIMGISINTFGETVSTLVTSLFLHGGLLHLGSNMLYLWIFGDNVEDRLGHLKYLLFYLFAGSLAGLAHIYSNPHSPVPTIGASGAVAGVLGAYFVTFPKAKILTLVPLGFIITLTHIRAVFFLFIWFILQLFNGLTAMVGGTAHPVAWWAHIGGFIAGALLIRFLKPKKRGTHF